MISPSEMTQSEEEPNKGKEKSEKPGKKLNIEKTKLVVFGPITS